MSFVRVRTPSGRLVHAAHAYHWTENTRYSVLCNQVPSWHGFKEVDESITCRECLRRNGGRP